MKRLVLASVIGLAACQTGGPAANGSSAEAPATADRESPCAADRFAYLVGTSGDAINAGMFPQGSRILRPGMVMTMDYRGDRMNIVINESGKVDRVYCG